eukprot:jgi/Psemu1/32037/gm1.32037_g
MSAPGVWLQSSNTATAVFPSLWINFSLHPLQEEINTLYQCQKNGLVTKRTISVSGVCLYCNYVWNASNRRSFMPCDHYNTLETKVKEKIKHNTFNFCLLYDLAAVQHRYHKTAKLVPKGGEFQLSYVTDLEVSNWNDIASTPPEHQVDYILPDD